MALSRVPGDDELYIGGYVLASFLGVLSVAKLALWCLVLWALRSST